MRNHHCGPRGWHFGRRGGFGPFGGPEFVMGWGMGVPGWGEHGERGGGRRRRFDGDALRLILLKLLSEQPRHGYDLIKEIESLSGGAYVPSPGVVYPALTLLDDMGLIEEQKAEGAKKQFAITEAGIQHLDENREQVEELMGRLAEMGSRAREHSDGGIPIRRAMGNLRAVLQNRFVAGGVDGETLHQMAEIIDEAARKIERL